MTDTPPLPPDHSALAAYSPSDASKEDAPTPPAYLVDSEKGDPSPAPDAYLASNSGYDVTADANVQPKLTQRHIQLISLAGAIGTGLFLSSGTNLAQGGPLGLMLSYMIVGSIVLGTMMALCEMACLAPTSGSFIRYAAMFVDKSLAASSGFCICWGNAISVASEVSAAVVIVQFWTTWAPAFFVTVFLVPIVLVNAISVRWLGEAESLFAMLKIILVVIFVITGIVVDCGGGPHGTYMGAHFWHKPGPLVEFMAGGAKGRFFGVWSCLISAAFSFAGTESVCMLAAETVNPRHNIKKAAQRVFVRVLVLYLLSMFMLTLLVPSDDPALLGDGATARDSPFVIAFNRAGIAMSHFVNAVVLTSALSSGEQAALAGSRALVGLSLDGVLPKFFTKTHRWGIPYIAVAVILSLSPLAYTVVSSSATDVFYYLSDVAAEGAVWSWMTINIAWLRMYYAMAKQGIPRSALPWTSYGQPYLTWYALGGCIFILFTSGFTCFITPVSQNFSVSTFLSSYLTIFVNLAILIAYKLFWRSKFVSLEEVPIRPWLRHAAEHPEIIPPRKHGWTRIFTFLWA